jgi:translation initiation factor 1
MSTGPAPLVLRRETKHRGGKQVTTVSGLAYLGAQRIAELAADLKRRCASGGTMDGGTIVLQGDHRDVVQAELEKRGFRVKRAGG